jgi:hypothetical protein
MIGAMANNVPKRKRGRPRTARIGCKVTMLPETYKALSELASADGMRLGAWLDTVTGAKQGTSPEHGVVSALRSARLQRVVRSAVSRLNEMDDLLEEDYAPIKDPEVLKELSELAIILRMALEVLRDAGLGHLVDQSTS